MRGPADLSLVQVLARVALQIAERDEEAAQARARQASRPQSARSRPQSEHDRTRSRPRSKPSRLDPAARAALAARVAELEQAIAKREEIRKAARQEALHEILDHILLIEEKECEDERVRGEADRVPIRKMAGLTPAQQIAELNGRTALRKKHHRRERP